MEPSSSADKDTCRAGTDRVWRSFWGTWVGKIGSISQTHW